jgi:cell wall-associated protease
MKIKTVISLFMFIILLGCTKKLFPIVYDSKNISAKVLTDTQKRNWQNLDLKKDNVPGTSYNRASQEIIKNKIGEQIIVAVLDTEFDIAHEDIKPFIWTNTKEIPNNNVDDDHNGYIDDIHGWNFVGNNKGESIINSSYECTRVLRFFKNNPIQNRKDSILYEKAKTLQKDIDKAYIIDKKKTDFYKSVFPRCYKTVKQFFPKGNYSLQQIDSVYKLYKAKGDKALYYDLYLLNELKRLDLDSTWVSNTIKSFDFDNETLYNEKYEEKSITKDEGFNIKDSIYGSNNVSKHAKRTWHGTQVAGLINSYKNTKIKIMPIVLSGIGGEDNDKDILTAIKYAVNNGAKVINMSSGKEISLHPEWQKEAILYAQKKDVLIITSAGNSGENIDIEPRYLLDYDEETGKEFCNNLIKVGGTSYNLNENILYSNSNYGHKNVDVFVPSYDLYVPDAIKGHTFNNGTSLGAAITSGTAALIRSYYPKLTAPQVKQIILDSGVSYDIEVIVPGTKDKKVKFSELSKSGKVVNVYNAMMMASTISN